MRLRKFQRVEIKWVDSQHSPGWTYEKELDPIEPVEIVTLGYFLKQTPATITVVQSRSLEEEPEIDAIMTIPKCAIRNIKTL